MSSVVVNGVCADSSHYPTPEAAAVHELLRQRALELRLIPEDADEAAIAHALEQLLDRDAPVEEPSEEQCRRYYAAHPHEFTNGEVAFARHILFQVTTGVPVPALRAHAELVLAGLVREPSDFESVARRYSNCPSAQVGGRLGALGRGEGVPELEQAIFNGAWLGICPQLVRSRFGFHILAVDRREPGELAPFEAVGERIRARLTARSQRVALERYIGQLAAAAQISGADPGSCLSRLDETQYGR